MNMDLPTLTGRLVLAHERELLLGDAVQGAGLVGELVASTALALRLGALNHADEGLPALLAEFADSAFAEALAHVAAEERDGGRG